MSKLSTDDFHTHDFQTHLFKLRHWLRHRFRWVTRGCMLLLTTLIVLHLIHPTLVEIVGEWLHFGKPSLTSVIALMLLIFMLERTVVIEELMRQPPISVHATRAQAYRNLAALIAGRKTIHVDAIQFTGQRMLPLLRDLAESPSTLHVRVLLADPVMADAFDADGRPNHRERLSTTLYELGELTEPGLTIECRYYSASPTLSAIICDDWLVAISWYYCVPDANRPSIIRLRSPLAPAILAIDDAGRSLVTFARGEFDSLWHLSTPILSEERSGEK